MHSIKHGAFQTAVDQIRTLHVVVEISGLLNQDPYNQGKSEFFILNSLTVHSDHPKVPSTPISSVTSYKASQAALLGIHFWRKILLENSWSYLGPDYDTILG